MGVTFETSIYRNYGLSMQFYKIKGCSLLVLMYQVKNASHILYLGKLLQLFVILCIMKFSKVLKRNSHDFPTPPPQDSKQTQQPWGKRSLIFTHTNTELFQGLLELTKQQTNSLSESIEEDQIERLNATVSQDRKNDEPTNLFIRAKVKAMLKKNSTEVNTTKSSDKAEKEQCLNPFAQLLKLNLKESEEENETVTWKQINQLQGLKKRHALKSLTDRNNRK